MEGSLFDLDRDGRRWKMRVYVGKDPSGRQIVRSRNFRGTKKEAQAELRKFIVEVQGGYKPGATVGQLIDAWWTDIGRRRATSTLTGYRSKLDTHLLPAFGRLKLERLTPARLDHQYRTWQEDGLAPATVRQLHAILSAALAQGVKWGWLQASPAKRATPPSIYRPRRKAITVPELQALVRKAEEVDGKGGALATAIALGAITGARRGELASLRWTDWDGKDLLTIGRSLTELKGGKWEEGPTKTHQERVVVLDVVGQAILSARREAQSLFASTKGDQVAPNAFILSRSANGLLPCLPGFISHGFADLVEALWPRVKDPVSGERIGLPKWHFHDTRHFVATVALASGASARAVADRLGHADPSLTLKVYSHAVDAVSRDLADYVGSLLAPVAELDVPEH